jgi:hypothetical protein
VEVFSLWFEAINGFNNGCLTSNAHLLSNRNRDGKESTFCLTAGAPYGRAIRVPLLTESESEVPMHF